MYLLSECAFVDFFFVDTTPFVDLYWKPSHQKYDWRGVIPREKYLKKQLEVFHTNSIDHLLYLVRFLNDTFCQVLGSNFASFLKDIDIF